MSRWGFDKEGNTDYQGANTYATQIAGNQPYENADVLTSKRNVIATDKGWTRRTHKKNAGSATTRQIDEVLVAASPGGTAALKGGYANSAYLGFPDIAQVYLANSSSEGVISIAALDGAGGSQHELCVVFNEPVKHSGAAGSLKLTFANTAGGNSGVVAVAAVGNSNTEIKNANNTLVFTFTPTAGDAGSYNVGAQAIINATSTSANLVSLNHGFASANLVITGAVANTLGTFTITAG